ncbi:MAG TPA: asparagine synthase-related protein, partial [Mycobacterium sp.]|nr:asparagine synthase-related protein [Mycobacterium sp.]
MGDRATPDPAAFAAMRSTLRHRGPDDAADLTVGPCSFGFQRLAIIDTHGSKQPLQYPPRTVSDPRWTVVCNGEIYNYRELRAELSHEHGCKFATQGDVEVLCAALDVWGPAALDRLRGMYSFVAWDAAERVLHAGRDPFGIKPLFFASTEAGLWLASEKKALMPVVDMTAVNTAALSYYLTLQYVPEPHTLHDGVDRLAAGERLTYRPGGPVEVRTWSMPIFDPPSRRVIPTSGEDAEDVPSDNGAVCPPGETSAHVAADIRDALRDSVRAHLVADVPVGAFLSSGIDSTAIVALAREFKPDLQTFTVGFEATGYSEVEAAAQAALEMGVRHT